MKQTLLLIFLLTITGSTPVSSDRTISLGDRIQYQRAIEQILWNHTVWPASNQNPKPALHSVVSNSAIENKVEQYLRKSDALATYWERPITADQMQTEMDRVARETLDPDLLLEIWNALNNDPYLIAECIVRPLLVDQLTNQIEGFDRWWNQQNVVSAVILEPSHANYRLPSIQKSPGDAASSAANTWQPTTTTGAPHARTQQVAVWTGTQMIIWGGWNNVYHNTGGRYSPMTNSWSSTSTVGAPEERTGHTGIWTGTELIVWGGFHDINVLNTGGKYNPITDTWVATSTNNAAAARYYHTALWTGSIMIVWGGGGTQSRSVLRSGGRYNPLNDSWTPTKKTGAPAARAVHTAVWTGTEMIVWGGHKFPASGGSISFSTGGRYNPTTNSWKPTTNQNAPYHRSSHTAVWTGSEMIIWGGVSNSTITLGGRYNPVSNVWSSLSTVRAPSPRYAHTAVWDGTEMIVWGGAFGSPLKTGAIYNPASNTWRETKRNGAPAGRSSHTAVWTDTLMIVWGGYSTKDLKTGGRYTP